MLFLNFSWWLLKYTIVSTFLLMQAPFCLFSALPLKEKFQTMKQCFFPVAIFLGIYLLFFFNIGLGLILTIGAMFLGALRVQNKGLY